MLQLVAAANYKTYKVSQGSDYSETRTKAAADITQEMLQDGSWKTSKFKPYNFNAMGQVCVPVVVCARIYTL